MRIDTAIAKYAAYRKALGERFRVSAEVLKSFCTAVGGNTPVNDISSEQINKFLNGSGPITGNWHVKYNALLGFYNYALSHDLVVNCPLPTVKPRRPQTFVPYIYTREELRRLLAAALTYQSHRDCLAPSSMVQAMLLLLYGAGLRLGEALSLRLIDVDLGQSILTIHDSKFFTSRLVPIGATLNERLRQYTAHRQQAGHDRDGTAPFFIKRNGRRMSEGDMEYAFQRIRQKAGIIRADGTRYQPRLHDLRHTFAVHRLTSWYRDGKDVQRLLPHLSVYLGHRRLAATSIYLTMTPELLEQASQRFEHYALGGCLP
jgi:site-specific recombinase XerD